MKVVLDELMTDEQKLHYHNNFAEHVNIAMSFCNLFGTSDGKKVLQNLRSKTIEEPTWCSSMPHDEAIHHGFMREGQNSVYRYIVDMIDNAPNLASQLQQI